MRPFFALFRTMRPRQWTKNAFVYAGIVFDGQLFVVDSLLRVTATFFLLCLISGSVYIINDLVDIERDRQHPKKRLRPLPSGALPIPLAVGAAIILPIFTISLALVLSRGLGLILLTYLAINLLYSFFLKHIVILDVLTITACYVLRVAAGVAVISVQAFSPWLYSCMALLALFLIVGKRRQELLEMKDKAGSVRASLEQYNLVLLDDMLRFVMMGTFITYLLYTIERPSILLAGNNLTLLTVPFVLYGLFRYLYLIHVKGEGSAPDEVLLRDRPLQLTILLWGLTFVVILYLPRLIS
ncbi:MAG: decaprenyl-phosphate phosphoribosyltransferase [Chloroflexota bacterium]|nr:decaprenyl-phosphate phosphoribosyltransferase [Chloroflexota bacterium]